MRRTTKWIGASLLAAGALTMATTTALGAATATGMALADHTTPAPIVTPAPKPQPWHRVTPQEGLASYLAAYGEQGCEHDFDENWFGQMSVDDLIPALADDIRQQEKDLAPDEGPAIADYLDGSVIEVLGHPDLVIFVGPYEKGDC